MRYEHRGDQTTGWTENSPRALRRAARENGAFETDLRTAADGRVVVMHDPERFVPYGGANVYTSGRSEAWIQRAHELGLRLVGRDSEDPDVWGPAVEAGVSGQILDDVAGYRTWCDSPAAP